MCKKKTAGAVFQMSVISDAGVISSLRRQGSETLY